MSCVDMPAQYCTNSQYVDEAMVFYGSSYLSDRDFCEAYIEVALSQPGSVTPDELADIENGVPHLSWAISRVVYNVDGEFNEINGCGAADLKNGITGGVLQKCVNEFIIEHGEPVLEKAACVYLSGGTLTPFCNSGLFKAAVGVVNNFANQYIEQPIVGFMDKVEDSLAGIAHKCASWFRGLFGAMRMRPGLSNASVVV